MPMHEITFDDIPLLRELDRIERASLVPNLEREDHPAGTMLVCQGDRGDALYLVVAGTASVWRFEEGQRRAVATLGPGECFGEMALLSGAPRSADVAAVTDITLLKLSRARFEELFRKHPAVSAHLSVLLARRFSQDPTASSAVAADTHPAGRSLAEGDHHPSSLVSRGGVALRTLVVRNTPVVLALVGLLCLAVGGLLASAGVEHVHLVLTVLLLGATLLWSLDLFSYHAVAVALPVLAVLFGAARPEQAFSGFSSPSWFLVLGVFAITAAIARTGLMYRLVLLFVRRFPPHYGAQTFALALAGLLLTPVIPSSNGRAALAGPLALTLSETLRFRRGSPGAVGIAMACLLGFGHLSFLFMNGTATCFLALGLLPAPVARSVDWLTWLVDALPLGIAYFLLSFAAIMLLHRPDQPVSVSTGVVDAQLRALGPMTRDERLSLVTVVVSLVAFATQSLHGINGAWVAMLSFLLLFASGVLDEKSVRSDIDWNFLISFGALVGFGTLISTSGLTDLAADALAPALAGFTGSPYLFLPTVSLAVHLARFALPLPAALLLGILTVVPVATHAGIHPFVVALVALASSNPWIVPYQNSIYLNILESTEGKVFGHEQVRRLALLQAIATLLAIIIAIPWWQHRGMIP